MGHDKVAAALKSMQDQIDQLKANDLTRADQIKKQAAEITQLKIQHLWDTFALDRQHKLEQSNRLGVEFIHSQLMAQLAIVTTTLGTLFMANNEYNGILGLKDAQKILSVDLLISFASIALPGLGIIEAGIKEWDEKGTAIKRFAAHLGGSASDYYGLAKGVKDAAGSSVDDGSLNISASSNNVIRTALLEAYRGLGESMNFANQMIPYVIRKSFTQGQIKSAWIAAGIPVVNTAIVGQSLVSAESFDLMEKVFLYDMLRDYTRKYVIYTFDLALPGDVSKIPANNLPEDGNAFGEFSGMTQATRDAIYSRFGGFNAIAFSMKTGRPVISGYRDMVREWRLGIKNG